MNVNEDLKFLLKCKKKSSGGGGSGLGEGRVWGVRMDKWGDQAGEGGQGGCGRRSDVVKK